MNSEKDTLPNNQVILDAIYELKSEIKNVNAEMNAKFDAINQRFESVDRQFDAINQRFESVDRQFDAINQRFESVDKQFDAVNIQFDNINLKFEAVNNRLEEMRLQMMSFDVRIDRLEAMSHELLNIAFNNRADVKVLREEVHAWTKEVRNLERKVA